MELNNIPVESRTDKQADKPSRNKPPKAKTTTDTKPPKAKTTTDTKPTKPKTTKEVAPTKPKPAKPKLNDKQTQYIELLHQYTIAAIKIKVAQYGGDPMTASYDKYLRQHFKGKHEKKF